MKKIFNLATIITNAFNKDYTADQAVADLEKLMNEATLIELTDGPFGNGVSTLICYSYILK